MPIEDSPDAPDQETAVRTFDDLLRALVAEGRDEVTVSELAGRYPYGMRSRTWMSRRMKGIAAGDVVAPDGITLHPDEMDAGRYHIVVLGPAESLPFGQTAGHAA